MITIERRRDAREGKIYGYIRNVPFIVSHVTKGRESSCLFSSFDFIAHIVKRNASFKWSREQPREKQATNAYLVLEIRQIKTLETCSK